MIVILTTEVAGRRVKTSQREAADLVEAELAKQQLLELARRQKFKVPQVQIEEESK